MSGTRRRQPLPFPQRPPRSLLQRMIESPPVWPEKYTVTISGAYSSATLVTGRVGMETARSLGERYGMAVHVEAEGARPIADLAAYRQRKEARE